MFYWWDQNELICFIEHQWVSGTRNELASKGEMTPALEICNIYQAFLCGRYYTRGFMDPILFNIHNSPTR